LAILKFEARLEQGLGLKVPDGGQLPLQHHMHGGLVLRQALPPAVQCCQLHTRLFRPVHKGNKSSSLSSSLPCQLPEEPSPIKLNFWQKKCKDVSPLLILTEIFFSFSIYQIRKKQIVNDAFILPGSYLVKFIEQKT
jgi:hypothetical protein